MIKCISTYPIYPIKPTVIMYDQQDQNCAEKTVAHNVLPSGFWSIVYTIDR